MNSFLNCVSLLFFILNNSESRNISKNGLQKNKLKRQNIDLSNIFTMSPGTDNFVKDLKLEYNRNAIKIASSFNYLKNSTLNNAIVSDQNLAKSIMMKGNIDSSYNADTDVMLAQQSLNRRFAYVSQNDIIPSETSSNIYCTQCSEFQDCNGDKNQCCHCQ